VKGLMQPFPLTVPMILRRAMTVGREMVVSSASPAGVDRRTWLEVGERSMRLAGALERLGVAPGAAVGSFAWNSHRHLELYLGVPCSGRALHAANVRLSPADVQYVVHHAGDEVLFVDAALTSTLAPWKDRLEVREFVVMEDGTDVHPAFEANPRYEELLAAADPHEPVEVAEDDAASVCFTSGTTGRPKAVVYSHRSLTLHSMSQLMVDAHAVRRGDVVLPLTPMFHVNGWGLPYTAALAPASLVLAGADTSPASVGRLIESERPTTIAGIPTFWIQMEELFSSGERDVSSVQRIMCGGAEAPPALIAKYTRLGIDFFHGWGMTEMSPSGSSHWIRAADHDHEPDARPGPATAGVELRLMGEDGHELPWDGSSVGELQARGPWVAAAYLDPDDDSNETRFDDGWLRTGDVARLTPEGIVEIVDRAKDLVKSGGEWISSVELERELMAHPAVREAAVVAQPHERWGERPLAYVVLAAGASFSQEEMAAFLAPRVAKWWIPERMELVDALPKTGVGKIDKKVLRAWRDA
jgi:acyl-CoA synthetase (AMP-forming)/AMP-acid ligase II